MEAGKIKKFQEIFNLFLIVRLFKVIWSDETKINRFESDGKSWYWTRNPEEFHPNKVKQTMKHGGGNIMVWGCITRNGVGPLVKIEGIMKKEQYLDILQKNLPEAIRQTKIVEENVIFQQDGDPKHTAKVVKNWLNNQKFSSIKWPAQSPDLNPIENLWAYMKKKLANYSEPPKFIL